MNKTMIESTWIADAVDVLFYCTKIDELILPMNSSTLNIIQQQYIVTEVFTQSGGA